MNEFEIEKIKNNIYPISKKIFVKFSSIEMGLGVFASEDIDSGELIERCPMIQLNLRRPFHKDNQLFRYCFTNIHCKCETCLKEGANMYMVLGYGMLYNHSNIHNTKVFINYENMYSDYIAFKPVKKGEELFINYGPNYFKKS